MADLSTEQLTGILEKAPEGVAHDDVMRQLIAFGHTFAGKKFDPQTLKPIDALPQSSSGQNIYPQPKTGDAPPVKGTDPIPDAARGLLAGLRGQETHAGASMPERVGQFVGKEGPAMAGMAVGAAATGGAALPVALGAAALGGASGEAYRQIFGRAAGGEQLTSTEAAHLMTAQAVKQRAAELGGRATTKTFQIIKGMVPEAVNALASIPASYVKRAMERADFALPKSGESLESVEKAAMGHLQGVQAAVEEGRASAGRMVDRALENLHVKTAGKKVADTQPLADAMRKVIDEKFRSGDPTVQALAKGDMEKIAKVLRTMDTTVSYADRAEGLAARKAAGIIEPGKEAFKQVNRPMKSIKDLVQIRRELDNMVGYTPAGVPKMSSDLGEKFAKSLADEYRGLIAKTAEAHGDKRLLLANANFSNAAKNYDEWQPILTTKTEGEPHLFAKMKGLYSYLGQGGAASESLNTLKEAFPRSARSVDALHDALSRRAFIMSPGAGEKEILKPLIRSIMGPGGAASGMVRGASSAAGSYIPGNVARALPQGVSADDMAALVRDRKDRR